MLQYVLITSDYLARDMYFKTRHSFFEDTTEKKNTVPFKLFLTHFNSLALSEKIQEIHRLVVENQVDFIVGMVEESSIFRETCALPEFSNIWISYWSTYGQLL